MERQLRDGNSNNVMPEFETIVACHSHSVLSCARTDHFPIETPRPHLLDREAKEIVNSAIFGHTFKVDVGQRYVNFRDMLSSQGHGFIAVDYLRMSFRVRRLLR